MKTERTGLRIATLLFGLFATTILPGCYASNVVSKEDRAVAVELAKLEWGPTRAADLPGLWMSVEIRGEVAATLWDVFYLFEEGGRYSAAALVAQEAGPSFQTMDGRWQCDEKGIVLDGGEAQQISRSGDHLRIVASSGTLLLRRVEQK